MKKIFALLLMLNAFSAYAGVNKTGFGASRALGTGWIKLSGEAASQIYKYFKENGLADTTHPDIMVGDGLVCWPENNSGANEYYCSGMIGKNGAMQGVTIDQKSLVD